MKTRGLSLFAFIVILGVLLTMAGHAQQADPGVLLRAAIEKEDVAGDLDGAMVLYRQIIAASGKDRAVTAKALLRLGGCLEKRGQAEARKMYERLLAEYADQAQEVNQARDRLTAISRAALASSREPRFREVAMVTGLGGYTDARLSPDGEEMAFTDRGAVWVIPVASRADPNTAGIPSKLTDPLGARGVAWTPDGRSIAFNTQNGISLVARSGGAPKEIVKDPGDRGNRQLESISFSPDGTRLAYSRGATLAQSRLYLGRTSGEAPVEFLSGTGNSMPAFSPDGKRVAYVHISKWERPPGRGNPPTIEGELWIALADGGSPIMASKLPGWPEGPVWSPDGSMVAFQQRSGPEQAGRPELRFLTVTADGKPAGVPARITVPFDTYALFAGWPAGNRIGLLRYIEEQENIFRVPAVGGRAAQISPRGYACHPRWSPDGKRIYIRWNKGQIGWMPAEGGEVTVIPIDNSVMEVEATPGGGNTVSPDGTSIVLSGAHQSHQGHNPLFTNIWTVGIEGGQPKQITNFTGPDARFPSWSPDGKRVAFIARDPDSNAAGSPEKPAPFVFQIYAVSPDGTGLKKLTSEAQHVDWSTVSWSPDGRWIAFFTWDKTLNLIPADGGDARVVTDLRRIDSLLVPGVGSLSHSEMAWSPDGKQLAFSFDGRLWTVASGGGAVAEIRTGLIGVRALHLDWSPDGRTIAFTGSEGGNERLWMMEDFLHLVKPGR